MSEQDSQFGSDKFTARNVFEIILLLIGLTVVGFFAVNTTLWQTAQIFWFLGLTATITVIAAFVITKSPLGFNVSISGEPLIPISKKILYPIFSLMGFLTFFVMSQGPYRIASPKFQILDPGLEGNVILSTFAAIFENDFFFVGIAGIIFALVYWRTKNAWASLGAVLLIVPMSFMGYHVAVYGLETVESWAVLLFGVEMTLAMVILRDVTYVHVRHVANNLGIIIFEAMDVQTLFISLMSSWIFWLVVGVVVVSIVVKLLKHKK